MTELVYLEETTKFWEGTLDGSTVTARYGKIGAKGNTTEKDHGSDEAARKAYDKLVAEKTKKGYKLLYIRDIPPTDEGGEGGPGKKVAARAKKTAAAPAKKAAASKPAGGGGGGGGKAKGTTLAYLENDTAFWTISIDGAKTYTRFGKQGAAGQTTLKEYNTPAEAKKAADKLVAEKKKKGYNEADAPEEDEVEDGGADAEGDDGNEGTEEDEEAEEEEEEKPKAAKKKAPAKTRAAKPAASKRKAKAASEDEEEEEEEEDEDEAPKKGGRKPPARAAKKAKTEGGGNELDGMVICQTGTMSVTRTEMNDMIAAHGGSVSNSLTKTTTHLLVGQMPSAATAKMQKAEDQGCKVITEAALRAMCGERK
ncbi:hypothetical protein HK104_002819 [Borealophlyctis nickersoniae]|nr:hypothetical protein HK104_002819 [Borealophlyctis nickersoniae]